MSKLVEWSATSPTVATTGFTRSVSPKRAAPRSGTPPSSGNNSWTRTARNTVTSSSTLPADSYVDRIRQRGRLLATSALAHEAVHRLTDHGSLRLRHPKLVENRFDDRIAPDDP